MVGAYPVRLAILAGRATRRALRRGMPRGELVRQLHEIGFRSLLLVAGGMVFFGAVMLVHGASQARQVVGDLAVVGPSYFEVMVRELGPTIAGVLAAVRIGAAVSAEVAAMKVTEQLDALRMSAADPYAEVVFPRLLAGFVAIPALIVVGTTCATLSTVFFATYVYGADGTAFMDATYIDLGDVGVFFLKSMGYGLVIPLASIQSGLSAQGGPGAVGAAATSGVVSARMLVLIVDLMISALVFLSGF